jgi:DNA replication and repair protein RecF
LIREGNESLTVFGRISAAAGKSFTMGVRREKDALCLKLSNHEDPRILDLLRALPVQVLTPGLHALLESGPNQRRRFIDWGVFHVEPEFFPVWQRYNRVLRQRNACLRKQLPATQVTAWDDALISSAERMDALRLRHVEDLRIHLQAAGHISTEVELQYLRGWPKEHSLRQLMRDNLSRDQRQGFTGMGPHRADLRLRWDGKSAIDVASRGEQKLLIAMLHLQQASVVGEKTGVSPVLLVDDIAAELGAEYRSLFADAAASSGMQVFMSFLERSQVPPIVAASQMFHVKQGGVTPSGSP